MSSSLTLDAMLSLTVSMSVYKSTKHTHSSSVYRFHYRCHALLLTVSMSCSWGPNSGGGKASGRDTSISNLIWAYSWDQPMVRESLLQ